jgi:hypothetical protein
VSGLADLFETIETISIQKRHSLAWLTFKLDLLPNVKTIKKQSRLIAEVGLCWKSWFREMGHSGRGSVK